VIKNEEKFFQTIPGMTHQEKSRLIGESYNIAYRFATRVYRSFPGILKSVVLFGSVAKKTITKESDIDILIIFDDTSLEPRRTFVDWYNTEITKIIQSIDPRIHVNTVTLSTFWDNVRSGEPVVINVLRYGIALVDTGFFEPLQMLLRKGKIRPTDEAVWNAMTRAPGHLVRSTSRVLGAVIDLYWVMIDSAHAALMKYGQVPPSPEYLEPLLKSTFVDKKMMDKKFISYYHEVWKTSKAVIHGELLRLSGIDYDRYLRYAEEFQAKMEEIIKKKK